MNAADKLYVQEMRLWLQEQRIIRNDSKRMERAYKAATKDAETLADLNRQQCEIISKHIIAEEKRLASFIKRRRG